jgi:hypothetical protein
VFFRLAEAAKGRHIHLQIGEPGTGENSSGAGHKDGINAEEWYKTIKARPECMCVKCRRMDPFELSIDWRAWREEAYIVDHCDGSDDDDDY